MWRSLIAVLLLPAITAAQAAQEPVSSTAAVKSVESSPAKVNYKPYTFYEQIRRGRDEQVALQLEVRGLVAVPKRPLAGIAPLKLELEPAEGLTFGGFRYPQAFKRKLKFESDPVPVSGWPSIQFKIRAAKSAPLGAQALRGKLTFQLIPFDGSSAGSVQQVDVEIPLTVVEHDASVRRAQWPFPHTPVALTVTLIVLLPVIIVVAIPVYAVCMLAGGKCMD